MKTIKEVFDLFENIGSYAFSTIDENGYPTSRIAHFIASDEEGLYFETMVVKPFYKQLTETKKISACGIPNTAKSHDENDMPIFEPSYTIRVSGDIRELTQEEIEKKAKKSKDFEFFIKESNKYKATRFFCLYKAHGEVFEFDFEKENKDHKLDRERFSWGDMEIPRHGLTIDDDKCITCGKCERVCSFDAVYKENDNFRIDKNRCDECGSCYIECPVKAISRKGVTEV